MIESAIVRRPLSVRLKLGALAVDRSGESRIALRQQLLVPALQRLAHALSPVVPPVRERRKQRRPSQPLPSSFLF